ncbi:MAG: ArnT family glycosyltransferase [Leptolyngbya sp. IPPAS B-1204]|nr:MAG: hypothetical protein EDM05_08435 [Leptolyngbya sp. IPPAS B-1204]
MFKGYTHTFPQIKLRDYSAQISLLLPILAIFLLTIMLVSPQGEFALNDDWIHAKAVQRLLEEGYYRGHPYVAATLVAQAYWGALFCKLFGFSFTTLRISTLVLAVIGAWAVAWSGQAMGLRRSLAILCGILYAINPILLSLSYSFMTDIPFLTFSALSGLCFLHFFRYNKTRFITLGSSFAVVGFFIRQFAIAVPAAFAITLIIIWWRSRYRFNITALVALIIPWLVGALLYFWFVSIKESGTSILLAPRHPFIVIIEAIRHYPIALCYMGFFALPLGLGIIWQIIKKHAGWNHQLLNMLLGFCIVSFLSFGLPTLLYQLKPVEWLKQFPYRLPLLTFDYLYDLAVGNPHLQDRYPLPPMQIGEVWWIITFASVVVAGLFWISSAQLFRSIWSLHAETTHFQAETKQRLFLVIWFAVALTIIFSPWRPSVDDRLLMPGLEPFILMLAYELNRFRHRVALKIVGTGTILLYTFSVLGLQNHFAWNLAVSEAQNKLINTYQISPEMIRGTDTFNGWYNSDKYMQIYNTKDFWQAGLTGLGPWTFDNQFIITSLDTLEGYRPFEQFNYFTWLGMKHQTITVFKRDQNSN